MKNPQDMGVSSSCRNKGDSGGRSTNSNRALRAEMAHVCVPGALAIVMATPFLKGSVLDEGIVMTMCDGARDGWHESYAAPCNVDAGVEGLARMYCEFAAPEETCERGGDHCFHIELAR